MSYFWHLQNLWQLSGSAAAERFNLILVKNKAAPNDCSVHFLVIVVLVLGRRGARRRRLSRARRQRRNAGVSVVCLVANGCGHTNGVGRAGGVAPAPHSRLFGCSQVIHDGRRDVVLERVGQHFVQRFQEGQGVLPAEAEWRDQKDNVAVGPLHCCHYLPLPQLVQHSVSQLGVRIAVNVDNLDPLQQATARNATDLSRKVRCSYLYFWRMN